ncbi:uncharacterized protein LOC108597003 [Drosophila busckii]|uniref:uncharacterized protein LOC108597003 n=1 Tax=Drosophila busckii TaxID=30019 RepID=UPI0014331C23|nr:uncharacterized protein LOC108597003 [Drosophila busckii]
MEPTSQPPTKMDDTFLRHKIREYAKQQRHNLRTNANDALRFGLGQIKQEICELENLRVKDVQGMAGRIKRRKHATTEDMYRLSHAFLQGNENINAFAATPGAIQVIVKELTGPNEMRRMEAADCLCNLSLGEAHVCEKITTLAGSYLVTFLHSQESRLVRSCLWTLANILFSCNKSAKNLLQMQLVTKLWKLYTAPTDDVHAYQDDAGVCLYLIAAQVASAVSSEDRHYIAEHLQEKQATDPAADYYMFIVYQFEVVNMELEGHWQHLYNFFVAERKFDLVKPTDRLSLLYGVRVWANILAMNVKIKIEHQPFISTLNKLFGLRDEGLNKELLQLLRNFIELSSVNCVQILERIQVFA